MGRDRQETKLRKETSRVIEADRDVTNYKDGSSYLDTPKKAREEQK